MLYSTRVPTFWLPALTDDSFGLLGAAQPRQPTSADHLVLLLLDASFPSQRRAIAVQDAGTSITLPILVEAAPTFVSRPRTGAVTGDLSWLPMTSGLSSSLPTLSKTARPRLEIFLLIRTMI